MLDCLIIGPTSKLNTAFGVVLIFCSLISTVTSAYYSCFGIPTDVVSIVLDNTMEVMFFLDIIRSCLKEYVDEQTHQPVRDLKKIAIRYFKKGFIFDAIG